MSVVYMKVLETAPERYERGMRLLTLGRWERVLTATAEWVRPGGRVLDLGCGTGALAVMLARRGCSVVGVEVAPPMLAQAARRVRSAGLADRVTLRELGVAELDTAFPDAAFDAVVATFLFGELSDDEIGYALAQCRRLLRPGGQLLVADEVQPDAALGRAAAWLLRLPFVLPAFILAQHTAHQVVGLEARIVGAGFRLVAVEKFLLGMLRLVVAEPPALAKDSPQRRQGREGPEEKPSRAWRLRGSIS